MATYILKLSGVVMGVLIGTELIVIPLYRFIRRRINSLPSKEINEVLFTSVDSGCCSFVTNAYNQHNPDRFDRMASKRPKKPCTNKYCVAKNTKRMIELIDGAKFSLDLAMYIFTSRDLGEAIIRANDRGINIRIIVNSSMEHSRGSQIDKFEKANLAVRYSIVRSMETLLHHKFCLIDCRTEESERKSAHRILMSGSMNWTMSALSGNWDNVIITSNPVLVDSFLKEYEKLWMDFNPKSMITRD